MTVDMFVIGVIKNTIIMMIKSLATTSVTETE